MKTARSHLQVKRYIVDQIRQGHYKVGDRIDTIRSIASANGVSTVTVSRAIQELAGEGVLRTEQGSGCYLLKGDIKRPINSGTIGLILPMASESTMDGWLLQCFLAIQNGMFTSRSNVLLFRGLYSTASEYPFVPPSSLPVSYLKGLMVCGLYDMGYIAELRELGLPLVALDMDATTLLAVDSVTFDQTVSASQLVKKLHHLGARRIAFFGGPFQVDPQDRFYFDPCAKDRLEGWRAGMVACGLEPREELVWGTRKRTNDCFMAVLRERLDAGPLPDAIVTEFPEEVKRELEQRGLNDGGILVAGWEDGASPEGHADIAARIRPKDMGRLGANMLLRRLANPSIEAELKRVSLDIVVREAVGVATT